MAVANLMNYLDEHRIQYLVISHSPAFTAQGIAGLTHISGKEMAKTVIVKLDGQLAMAVLPAKYLVDLGALRRGAHVKEAVLAPEDEFRVCFPECETGAMPPFGNLYGMRVFADASLEQDKEIAFNAGTHRELVRMAWEDFKKLVKPAIIRFAAGHSSVAA